MLDSLSPLDGRYAKQTEALRAFFSEEALIRARVLVEVRYFQALAAERSIRALPKLKRAQKKQLDRIVERFSTHDAEAIKAIEKKTNHDVKAVEYFLKQKMQRIAGLKKFAEFIHFGLTSEDINNLAYGILIHDALRMVLRPALKFLHADLLRLSRRWAHIDLLSLTHGQPATPTTVGREFLVFADRLGRQRIQLKVFRMQGKFGGAVGNYRAHKAAYPDVPWEKFGRAFMRSLGLDPLTHTIQINPHDDLAELSHLFVRINTIMLDLSRDLWLYIGRGVFRQKIIAGEVGSSTMPHKVNPIDFENAEGNVGVANALFSHFAEKLPVSRLQRDLSDSTVQRNLGVAFGHHTLAVASLRKGLAKLSLNQSNIQKELDAHPEVHAEAIQIVLRKYHIDGGYERLKRFTRGRGVTREQFIAYVDGLPIPRNERQCLQMLFR